MRSFVDVQYRDEVETHVKKMPKYSQKGEEGLLYRLGSGVEVQPAIWVKKWYRSHDNHVTLPEEMKGSATSPHFHALRKMEYDLAHQAFPEHVVEMVGAYDTRIDRGSLQIAPGHPTTITKEPVHDSELLAYRNEIVTAAYEEFFRLKALLRQQFGGAYNITQDRQVLAWRARTNTQIHDLLGRELDFPLMGASGDLMRNVERLRAQNRGNVIITMIEAGIYPIHPELNYIPRVPSADARPPHGTFIELRFYDLQKLEGYMRKKLGAASPEFQEFSRKLSMLNVYKKLDEVFTRLILHSNFGSQDYLKIHNVILTAMYRVLESLSVLYERGTVKLNDAAIISRITTATQNAFQSSSGPECIAQRILQIEASF